MDESTSIDGINVHPVPSIQKVIWEMWADDGRRGTADIAINLNGSGTSAYSYFEGWFFGFFTESETGAIPYLITDVHTISVTLTATNFEPIVIDTAAVLSVLEVTTNTTLHNDGDINDDGSIDEMDIDMLDQAIRSGAFTSISGANSNEDNAIGMFDVNGDGDVDIDDMDELVLVELLSNYGDADLDGDVDEADLSTASANYTGPVGIAGRKGWADGDTDGDGDVDDNDFNTMYSNYTGPL